MLSINLLRATIVVLLAIVAEVAFAQQGQAWSEVQRQLQKNAGIVAHKIAVRFEVPDDAGGTRVGEYQTRISHWRAQGQPVRELVKESASPKSHELARLDLSLAERIANHPDQLFERPESIVASADGVYQIRTRFVDGTRPVTARIWIDRDTGALRKVEGTIEKVGLPGVASANFSLRYATDAAGRSLPESLSLAYTLSLFFHTGEFSFVESFSDWRSVDVARGVPGSEQR